MSGGQPRRILFVCERLRAWGSGQDVATWRLIRALSHIPSVELTVVTARVADPLPGVRVIRLPVPALPWLRIDFLLFRLCWKGLGWILRRGQHRVVAATPLLPGCDVAMVHFLSMAWQEQAATLPAPPGIGGWGSRLRRWHDQLRHGLAARQERQVYARADRPMLLPVSAAVAEDVATRFGGRGLHVLPNATDPQQFQPLRPGAARVCAPNTLLFIGGHWRRKRLDWAIRALSMLPEPVRLLVIGSGAVADYRRLAAALGVADRVNFLGPQRQPERYLASALAVLLPSAYETDGLVAWEALCCGVPVIAVPAGGSAAWLKPGVTGYAVASPEQMAAAVEQLRRDPGRAARMGRVGRWLAQKRGPERIAARFLAVVTTDDATSRQQGGCA